MKSSVTSEPHSTITPPSSWPSVNGHGKGFGQWPFRMCWSVPHTPQAPIWINAALRGTCGHGTVRITGGAPGPSKVATRIWSLDMLVMRGLDPRIHLLLLDAFVKGDGLPGQARQ